jgi:hypothetical protein
MTDKQPEALRLADRFADITDWWDFDARTWIPRTEAELRRLHEVNAELLKALNKITLVQNENPVIMYQAMEDIARAAIAKAEVTK